MVVLAQILCDRQILQVLRNMQATDRVCLGEGRCDRRGTQAGMRHRWRVDASCLPRLGSFACARLSWQQCRRSWFRGDSGGAGERLRGIGLASRLAAGRHRRACGPSGHDTSLGCDVGRALSCTHDTSVCRIGPPRAIRHSQRISYSDMPHKRGCRLSARIPHCTYYNSTRYLFPSNSSE